MVNLQTRDILEQARRFHRDLRAYYETLGKGNQQERVRLLLDYMQRHEETLDKCLEQYALGAGPGVLNTWFKHAPEISAAECFEGIDVHDDMSVDEVIRVSLQLDDRLIAYYRRLADLAVAEEVKDLFNDLLREEQNEERRMARDAIEFGYD